MVLGALAGARLHFRVLATPTPAHRQVGRQGQVFWAKSSAQYLAACQQQIALQAPASSPLSGLLSVALESVFPKPKKTILSTPRGDVDNLAKHPLDALRKAGVIGDDHQIVELLTVKRWAEPGEYAHCNIWIGGLP